MPNIIEITTPDAPGLDLFAHLTNAQLRSRSEPEKGIFIAESPKVIRIALDAGYEPVAMLMERKHLLNQGQPLIERCSDIPIYTGDREVLAGITGYTLTRGILCAMKRPAPLTPAEVCGDAHRIAVLDGIVDATNIGAIFRSAAAMHMDGVLVTPTCCDPLNRRAVRVSMGTVFQIPWAQIGSCSAQWPVDGMQMLHKMGFRTAAMVLTQDSVSNGGRRALPADHRSVRLHRYDPHVPRGGLLECSRRRGSRLLAVAKTLMYVKQTADEFRRSVCYFESSSRTCWMLIPRSRAMAARSSYSYLLRRTPNPSLSFTRTTPRGVSCLRMRRLMV